MKIVKTCARFDDQLKFSEELKSDYIALMEDMNHWDYERSILKIGRSDNFNLFLNNSNGLNEVISEGRSLDFLEINKNKFKYFVFRDDDKFFVIFNSSVREKIEKMTAYKFSDIILKRSESSFCAEYIFKNKNEVVLEVQFQDFYIEKLKKLGVVFNMEKH